MVQNESACSPERILIQHAKLDYYQMLGVHSTASPGEIKSACARLVNEIRSHGGPDVLDRLLELRRACVVLTDSTKRAICDKEGANPRSANSVNFTDFDYEGFERKGRFRQDERSLADLLADTILELL